MITAVFLITMLVFPGAMSYAETTPDGKPQTIGIPLLTTSSGSTVEMIMGIQFWSIFTMNEKADVDDDDDLDPVDDRADFFLRRARFGIQGQIIPALSYNLVFAFDQLGRNDYTGTVGSIQDENNLNFFLWDMLATWQIHEQAAFLTFGYFRPQVGRESITSAFAVDSFMKALTNGYPRKHMLGRSSARETGLNLGGLANGSSWQVLYNVGFFDTNHTDNAGDLDGDDRGDGQKWSPLFTGRLVLSLGDPEMTDYGLRYSNNYFGKRHGISVAVNGSWQNENDVFDRNTVLGADVLANCGQFAFSAEYDILARSLQDGTDYQDSVYHIRSGYNVPFGKYILEPTVMYSVFEGDSDSPTNGTDEILDIGLNWYLNKNKLKVNLHYTLQDGESKSGYTDGKTFERGDIIGLGVQFTL